MTPGIYADSTNSLLIGSDSNGFWAMSSICTHAGCDMANGAGSEDTSTSPGPGYDCNCHGSVFDANGNVVSGPASRGGPLANYQVILGCDGMLYVNQQMTVPQGTRVHM